MMQEQQNRKYAIIFYTVFTMLNIIQAYSTQLIDDEAYYWVYSKFLAWGYYDHPPMIAVLIKIGYTFFHNELGVRLLLVAISTGSIYLLEKIVAPTNKKLFFAIILNIAALQFAGFIAVPDIPLLFFVVVYFYRYKKFAALPNLQNTLLWGISMSLMLYSKYHGILIIFFTLISNPKLLTRWQIYIAGALGAALFLPHLLWQYNHGFPSVYYHLWDRNTSPYKIAFTTEYILGQIALAGPILGWLFLAALTLYKPTQAIQRALQFSAIGFYLFFLLSSLHGRIEANWTIPALSCIAAIAYFYFVDKIKWHSTIYIAAIASFVLVSFVRLVLFTGIIDVTIPIFKETRGNKEWATSIQKAAAGKPVLFLNAYQSPSKYWFYTGDTGFAINTPAYRQNNFNIWDINKNYLGRDVALVTMGSLDSSVANIETAKGNARIKIANAITFSSDVLFYVERKNNLQNNLPIVIKGKQYGGSLNSVAKEKIILQITNDKGFSVEVPCNNLTYTNSDCAFEFSPTTLTKGMYFGKICIATSIKNTATLNSNIITIEAK